MKSETQSGSNLEEGPDELVPWLQYMLSFAIAQISSDAEREDYSKGFDQGVHFAIALTCTKLGVTIND